MSLPEVLVAAAITVTLGAGVLRVVGPAAAIFDAQPELGDVQQRLRVGLDTIETAFAEAGRGPSALTVPWRMADVVPAVMPYRVGLRRNDVAAGVYFRPDVATVVAIESVTQALSDAALTVDAAEARLAPRAWCAAAPDGAACAFEERTRALLVDPRGAWDLVTIAGTTEDTVQFSHPGPLTIPYARAALLAAVQVSTFHLGADAGGVPRLMRYDGHASDLPVVDHVVGLAFEYFGEPEPPRVRASADPAVPQVTYGPAPPAPGIDDPDDAWLAGENCTIVVAAGVQVSRLATFGAGPGLVPLAPARLQDGPWCPDAAAPNRFDADLLRIRRVRIVLRVEVAAARLRGPAGVLFTRGGTSPGGAGLVPDQELRIDVTPRNLNLRR